MNQLLGARPTVLRSDGPVIQRQELAKQRVPTAVVCVHTPTLSAIRRAVQERIRDPARGGVSGLPFRRSIVSRTYGSMTNIKTSLEIPDAIFRRAKSIAAERGIPLRELVTEAVKEKLAQTQAPSERPWMAAFGQTPTSAKGNSQDQSHYRRRIRTR